jgi:plastocyanin
MLRQESTVSGPRAIGRLLLGCAGVALSAGPLAAQSVLERTPNLSGGWVASQGVVQFDFVHRFNVSPAPERKVTSFPSFVFAAGLPGRTMLGFTYATNSTLVSRNPNEWEFFGQVTPMQQSVGRPADLGIKAGYNQATRGLVGELSVARRAGPVRLLAATRLLDNPEDGPLDVAVVGGTVMRLGRWVALAGDVATLLDRSSSRRVAWSAGLQLGIPHTPHTLSLQATNTLGTSLEAASRGSRQTLYGFEFTIPITLKRYLGGGTAPPRGSASTVVGGAPGSLAIVRLKTLAYGPNALTIMAGTIVEWANDDPVAHTVTAGDSTFDSGLIEPRAVWRHVFTEPGTYTYACRPHPFMKGIITVVAQP